MKYLHIMPPSQRMLLTYIEMLQKDFPLEDHRIQLSSPISSNDSGLLLLENIRSYEGLGKGKVEKLLNIIKELNDADRIVFHSFMPTKIWTTALLLNQHVLNKSIWVIWGIDMYNYKRGGKTVHDWVMDKIGYYFRRSMKYPVVVSEPDIEVYKKTFKRGGVLYAPYSLSEARFVAMDRAIKQQNEQRREEKIVNIQVCHNGFVFNNHMEILKYLSPLCAGPEGDRIMLYLPLSYGDGYIAENVSYVKALKSYASQKFSGNINIMHELMPNQEYTRFLSQIDIAIFNASRHNALGNILQLLYMGKKVYLSDKSPLLSYLREKGFTVHKVSELNGITFEELTRNDNVVAGRELVRKSFGVDAMRDMWTNIFNYAEGKIDYRTARKTNINLMNS